MATKMQKLNKKHWTRNERHTLRFFRLKDEDILKFEELEARGLPERFVKIIKRR